MIVGNGILKPLVARVRPCTLYPGVSMLSSMPTDYSFPSGHAFSSFAAAVAIFCQRKKLGIVALILAAGIGFSRMYLFVHFPSDVLAGVFLGTLSGVAAYKLSCSLAAAWELRQEEQEPAVLPLKNDEIFKQ